MLQGRGVLKDWPHGSGISPIETLKHFNARKKMRVRRQDRPMSQQQEMQIKKGTQKYCRCARMFEPGDENDMCWHCTRARYESYWSRNVSMPMDTNSVIRNIIKSTMFGMILMICPVLAHAVTVRGEVSFYGAECCRFNKDARCSTANGESLYSLIKEGVPYVAMWEVPFGTKVSIKGPSGQFEGVLKDRGPNKRLKRAADLSPIIFKEVCGPLSLGVCNVEITYES